MADNKNESQVPSEPEAEFVQAEVVPPRASPAAAPPTAASKMWILWIVIPLGVLLLVCGGVLVLIVVPAVQAAGEAAQREQCRSNLHQIGQAMQSHCEAYNHFPQVYVPDENGKPKHSWRVMLLPYLGEHNLYKKYNLDEPWDSPANQKLAGMMPKIYHCPSDTLADASSETSYLMVAGPGTMGPGGKARVAMWDIRDGSWVTILLVEVAGSGVNWLEPRDWDTSVGDFSINQGTGAGIGSEHPGAANVLFCDGKVRTIDESTDPNDLKTYTTRAGFEQPPPLPHRLAGRVAGPEGRRAWLV